MQNGQQTEIERPDEHATGDELYCWMPGSEDRECNGSCVAYDSSYEEDQRKDPCKVLNAVRSIGLSVAKLSNLARVRERAAAVPQPEPPEVR